MANERLQVTGTFSGTGTSASVAIGGKGTFSLIGSTWQGTVVLQRSLDAGTTWATVDNGTFTDTDAEKNICSHIPNALFRLNCTARTTGSIAYALGYSVAEGGRAGGPKGPL